MSNILKVAASNTSVVIQMSTTQRDRIVRALELLDTIEPIEIASNEFDDLELTRLAAMMKDSETGVVNGLTL
jgi:hypothetical protein